MTTPGLLENQRLLVGRSRSGGRRTGTDPPPAGKGLVMRFRKLTMSAADVTDDLARPFALDRERWEAARRAEGKTPPYLDPPDDRLRPVEDYLRTGRREPWGTPKQTAWAVNIKGRVWPRLAGAVRDQLVVPIRGDYATTLALAARAGYPVEVAPLLAALEVVRTLDRFDSWDARCWIDLENGRRPHSAAVYGRREGLPAEGRTVLERAARLLPFGGRPLVLYFLQKNPTPAHWARELEERGVRHDGVVTDRERRFFEAWQAGESGPVDGLCLECPAAPAPPVTRRRDLRPRRPLENCLVED
jgi:hypothetical protein